MSDGGPAGPIVIVGDARGGVVRTGEPPGASGFSTKLFLSALERAAPGGFEVREMPSLLVSRPDYY